MDDGFRTFAPPHHICGPSCPPDIGEESQRTCSLCGHSQPPAILFHARTGLPVLFAFTVPSVLLGTLCCVPSSAPLSEQQVPVLRLGTNQGLTLRDPIATKAPIYV
eukprot:GGOE01012158.1.p8 GENE.GGOE01012158.1~~GGOE01012158.1.p8  ORF type:complete len:106 (+),score=8.06 GGOE01012158.1:511-828(+)